MKEKMLMTSGFNFEGYIIEEYLGVFTGECALGTGFLSSLGAGIADMLGANSTMYSEKLKKAKDYAIAQLIQQVENAGGNAIIGLDIDYTSFSADIMGVVASGTAVKILNSSCLESEEKIIVRKTNKNLNFKVLSMSVKQLRERTVLFAEVYSPKEFEVKGILTDISLRTIFNDTVNCSNVGFIDFRKTTNNHYVGNASIKDIPLDTIPLIKNADIYVKKYVVSGEVICSEGAIDMVALNESGPQEEHVDEWKDDILAYIESLKTAKEIAKYIEEYNSKHNYIIDQVIIDEADRMAELERIYGNEREDCIKMIRDHLE